MKKILIVGSGISGATCANLLSYKDDFEITIIQKNHHIGGNCYDYLSQDESCYIHKYGPHIFHTKKKQIWQYINQFSDFTEYRHLVYSKFNEQNYIFPINLNTISQVFNKQIYSKEDVLQLINDYHKEDPKNFQQLACNNIGTRLYEMFIKNYTMKQWKTDPINLSKDIFKRIDIRYNFNNDYFQNQYQGMPKNGYTELISNMLNHKNINIILNCQFKNYNCKNYDYIIYTGGFDGLPYRSTKFIHYVDKIGNISVLNTPQDQNITRITNFNILHKVKNNNQLHNYCKEIPLDNNTENQLYPIINEQNLKLFKVKQLQMLKKYPNIIFCGRLANYKYLDMDLAIENAMDVIKNNF